MDKILQTILHAIESYRISLQAVYITQNISAKPDKYRPLHGHMR